MDASSLTQAITNITSVMSTVVSTIADNVVLMTFFCAGLVGTAIGLVHKLK